MKNAKLEIGCDVRGIENDGWKWRMNIPELSVRLFEWNVLSTNSSVYPCEGLFVVGGWRVAPLQGA